MFRRDLTKGTLTLAAPHIISALKTSAFVCLSRLLCSLPSCIDYRAQRSAWFCVSCSLLVVNMKCRFGFHFRVLPQVWPWPVIREPWGFVVSQAATLVAAWFPMFTTLKVKNKAKMVKPVPTATVRQCQLLGPIYSFISLPKVAIWPENGKIHHHSVVFAVINFSCWW